MNIENTPSIGRTVREVREQKHLTLQHVADRTGVHKSVISKIENGKQKLDFNMLLSIAAALDVDATDLVFRAEHGLEPGPDVKGTVPLISWVQAGQWQEAIDTLLPGQGERVATTYRVRRHTYALRVRGDSMEPKFPDGCTIIVEPEESPDNGAYVIVRQNGGEATFKQLLHDGGRRYLKPLNPRYPIMELLPDAQFCGVVKKIEMDV